MKKKSFLLCFSLILTSNFIFTQEKNQFLVLLSNGKNILNHEIALEVGQAFTFSNQDSIGVEGELVLRQIGTSNIFPFLESKIYTTTDISKIIKKEQLGFRKVSFTQDETHFLVLLSKGENLINNHRQISVGQYINFSNQDSIGVEGELILRQVETGNTVFFTENRSYSITEIINALVKEQEKYGFAGIYYFFGEHQLQGYDFRRKKITKVIRELPFYSVNKNSILYELNEDNEYPTVATYKVYNSEKIRIMWKPNVNFKSYVIHIQNIFSETIESYKTDKLYHIFELSDTYNITGDLAAFAVIYDEGQELVEDYLLGAVIIEITKLCDEIYSEVKEDYTKIFGENTDDKIIEALFFEMRGLYPDAARCLGEAIDMTKSEEEKKAYERLYDSFLHEYFPIVREDYENNSDKIQYLKCR